MPTTDASVSDAAVGVDATSDLLTTYACVPAGNNTAQSASISAGVWTGYRFEVPADAIQFNLRIVQLKAGGTGTLFAALVRLTGPSDVPDTPTLTSSDVLQTAIVTLSGNASTITQAPLLASLSPGWYGIWFGAGAFGAPSATNASANSQSAGPGCTNRTNPVSIIQSNGTFVAQNATPYFAAVGTLVR
jgi:hypothetical protein